MVHLVYGSREKMRFACDGVELNTQSVWTWQGTFQQPRGGQRPIYYAPELGRLRVGQRESGEAEDLYRSVIPIESPRGLPLEVHDELGLVYTAPQGLQIKAWQGAVTLHDPLFDRKVADFGYERKTWMVDGRELEAGLFVGPFAFFDGLPYVAPVGVRQRLSSLAAPLG